MIKSILNLYAGIGGNRALWPDNIKITAIEKELQIGRFYIERFKNDLTILLDAHDYLLKHYKEYDFIWSSPPCQSHSVIRMAGAQSGQYKPVYPDLRLYQEIIFLKYFAPKKTKWVVENVCPFYDPLVGGNRFGRHLIWSNFYIPPFTKKTEREKHNNINGKSSVYGVVLPEYITIRKDKVLRNMVDPELGLHILNSAMNIVDENCEQVSFDIT